MKFINSLVGELVHKLQLTPEQSGELRNAMEEIPIGFWINTANIDTMAVPLAKELLNNTMREREGALLPSPMYCRVIFSRFSDIPFIGGEPFLGTNGSADESVSDN